MWPTIWTVGHSTRRLDEFLAVLEAYDIECVADVRRFPASRRLPQFAAPALEAALEARGVAYRWLPALGGRRQPAAVSSSDGWRHPAFRAYADYTTTEAFAEGRKNETHESETHRRPLYHEVGGMFMILEIR